MGIKTKKPIILYPHGAKKMDFVLDKKQWKKKVMRLQLFQNY